MLLKKFPFLLPFLFLLSYLLYYPNLLLITDEQSYFNLALSLLSQDPGVLYHEEVLPQYDINIIEAKYAIGTPLLLAPLIAMLGNQGIFLLSLICFISSYLFVLATLNKLDYDHKGVLLFFVFLPLLFIMRTIMSELPSLLLVSIAIYILAVKKENIYWLTFVLGGISIVFRETNALIFGPLLLYVFFRSSLQKRLLYAITFISSLGVRLISNYWVYGDAFHLKQGYPFSLSYVDNNLFIYAIILLVFVPGGLFLFMYYKGFLSKLFLSIILIFTCVHLCYGYNGIDFSGFKVGSLLNGRFFIPLLPIFCIQIGWLLSQYKWSKTTSYAMYIGSLLIAVCSQIYLHKVTSNHYRIAEFLNQYEDKVLIFDHSLHSNMGRYINPFLKNLHSTLDISRLGYPGTLDSLRTINNEVYIVQSEREETPAKMQRSKDISSLIESSSMTLQIDTILYTGDGGIIKISKIRELE